MCSEATKIVTAGTCDRLGDKIHMCREVFSGTSTDRYCHHSAGLDDITVIPIYTYIYLFTHTMCVVYTAVHEIHKETTSCYWFKALNNTERTMSRESLSLKENQVVERDCHKETTQWFKVMNNTERTMSRDRLSLRENRETMSRERLSLKGNQT